MSLLVTGICPGFSQQVSKTGMYGWQSINTATTQNLIKVHFADPSTGYISGAGGLVMKSSNGGETWSKKIIPSLSDFWCVYASSPDDVFVGAWDTIYSTHNGGASWSGIHTPTLNFNINDIQFLNPSEGVAMIAASTCLTTSDGGETWSPKGGAGIIEDFYGSHFLTKDYGFGVGDCGLIAKTIDGGETWTIYPWDGPVTWTCIKIYDVYFTSPDNGFAVADSGYLYRTTNAGVQWSKIVLAEETDTLKSICFVNSRIGYIAGSRGTMLKTEDGGDNWFPEWVPTTENLNSVYFVSDSLGFTVGGNGTILIYRSPASGTGPVLTNPLEPVTIYPNPVKDECTIEISLEEPTRVDIDLYQIDGRWVRNLARQSFDPGTHRLPATLDGIAKGPYICRVTAGQLVKQKRLMVY